MDAKQQQSKNPTAGAAKERYAVVLYDFEGNPAQRTLTVFSGDVVKVEVREGREWWPAELNGQHGFVPKNFVKLRPVDWTPETMMKNNIVDRLHLDNDDASSVVSDGTDNSNAPRPSFTRSPISTTTSVMLGVRKATEKTLLSPQSSPIKSTHSASISVDTSRSITFSVSSQSPPPPVMPSPTTAIATANNNNTTASASAATTSPSTSSTQIPFVPAVALYKFQPKDDRQLGFAKRDMIMVRPNESEKWWEAELNGTKGLVPSNYVRLLKEGETVESEQNGEKKTRRKTLIARIVGDRKKSTAAANLGASSDAQTARGSGAKSKKKKDKAKAAGGGDDQAISTLDDDGDDDDDDDDDEDDEDGEGKRNSKNVNGDANPQQSSSTKGDSRQSNLDSRIRTESDAHALNHTSDRHVQSTAEKKKRMASVRWRKAIALQDFTALTPNELSFKQGDYIHVEPKVSSDWWPAVNDNKEQGLVPCNLIRVVEEHKKGETLKERRATSAFAHFHEVSSFQRLTGNVSMKFTSYLHGCSSIKEIPFLNALFSDSLLYHFLKVKFATNKGYGSDSIAANDIDESLKVPSSPLLEKCYPAIEKSLRYQILQEGKELKSSILFDSEVLVVVDGEVDLAIQNKTLDTLHEGQFFCGNQFRRNQQLQESPSKSQLQKSVSIKSRNDATLLSLSNVEYLKLCKEFTWFETAMRDTKHLLSHVLLCQIPFFRDCDYANLDILGALFSLKTYRRGETPYRDGEISSDFFIVLKGEVTLSVTLSDGTRKELRKVSRGGFFGEESLITSDSQPMSIMSKKSTVAGDDESIINKAGITPRLTAILKKTTSTMLSSSSPSTSSPQTTQITNGNSPALGVQSSNGIVRISTATIVESGTILMRINSNSLESYMSQIDNDLRARLATVIAMRSSSTLTGVNFFAECVPQNKMDILAAVFEYDVFQPNEFLFRSGEMSDKFYILCEGELQMLDNKGELIATLKPGEYFGEAALLDKKPRSSTVVCVEPSICISLSLEGYQRFVSAVPEIMTSLTHAISLRAQAENVKHRWVPTSPDELSGTVVFKKELFATFEAKLALERFRQLGRHMAPCLRILKGHPQYMHAVPFEIARDPSKPFVVTIIKLDENMDAMRVDAKITEKVGELVSRIFEKYQASTGRELDPAGPEIFGLKVAARADYLVDRNAELGRYKIVTKFLRRGQERGELHFALVDLRLNPKNGSGVRTVAKASNTRPGAVSDVRGSILPTNTADGISPLSPTSNAGPPMYMEAVALYDSEDPELKFKAGDRLEVDARGDHSHWPVYVNGAFGFIPRNYVKSIQPLPDSMLRQFQASRNRSAGSTIVRPGGALGLEINKTNSGGSVSLPSSPYVAQLAATNTNNPNNINNNNNNNSNNGSGPAQLLGVPPMLVEDWAKAISQSSSAVDKVLPPWGDVKPSDECFTSNEIAWPLRIRVKQVEKLNRHPDLDEHLFFVVRVELVFAGEVIETRYTRPIRKGFTLRFDDDWIFFDRMIGQLPFSARLCFTLLGLNNANIEIDTSMYGRTTQSTPLIGSFGSNATLSSDPFASKFLPAANASENQIVLDPSGTLIPQSASDASIFAHVATCERASYVSSASMIASQLAAAAEASSPGRLTQIGRMLTGKATQAVRSTITATTAGLGSDDCGKPVPLGGVSFPIWRADLMLQSGCHSLSMWQNMEAEKETYCVPNPDSNAIEICIEIDSFAYPVRFDMPPTVPVVLNDGEIPMRTLTAMNNQKTVKIADTSKSGSMTGAASNGQQSNFKAMANKRKSVSTFKKVEVKVDKKPVPGLSKKVAELLAQDPLKIYKMSAVERNLVWSEREALINDPTALSKLMLAVDWSSPQKRDAALILLGKWATPTPMQAMELLGSRFGEYRLREYAVKCLEAFDDDELSEFLLQLTQALKYEPLHDSPLARFLLKRALANPREVGNRFFWSLRAEMHVTKFATRFGLLLQAYLQCCDAHIEELTQQHDVQELLKGIAEGAQKQKFNSREERTEYARTELAKLNNKLPGAFQFALDPRIKVKSFNVSKCKVMSSKKRPLWLSMNNYDPVEGGGEPILVMFKAGDDLRQDQMTLQILRVMEHIWLAEGINLRLTPYGCVSTGDELGMLEIVPNSDTTAGIQKAYGGAFGAFQDSSIRAWLEENNKGNMKTAVENFVYSCAGYCVATYVMGIGDRHSDNIMVTKLGNLFHIDFGHFLGNFKTKLGFKRERTAFVFTKEMAAVMGGKGGKEFSEFVDLCCTAYNLLRRHGDELISLFRLMIPAGMPELTVDDDIQYLCDRLQLGLTEEKASESFKAEIDSALADTYRRVDNFIHNMRS